MVRRLAPSGALFLPEVRGIAERATTAADLLRQCCSQVADPAAHREAVDAIADHVAEADRLSTAVRAGVVGALITPVDREDLSELTERLRALVAAISRTARIVAAARVDGNDAAAELGGLLAEAVDSLHAAAAYLSDQGSALALAADVRQLVGAGDQVYTQALAALLADVEPVEAVRRRAVYAALQEPLRACARAAQVVERIALKRV